jgi:hypothetical protein
VYSPCCPLSGEPLTVSDHVFLPDSYVTRFATSSAVVRYEASCPCCVIAANDSVSLIHSIPCLEKVAARHLKDRNIP